MDVFLMQPAIFLLTLCSVRGLVKLVLPRDGRICTMGQPVKLLIEL